MRVSDFNRDAGAISVRISKPGKPRHVVLADEGKALMGVIAAQLGHADTRMTEKHYAHLSPSYVADTVRAALPSLGSSINGRTSIFTSSRKQISAFSKTKKPSNVTQQINFWAEDLHPMYTVEELETHIENVSKLKEEFERLATSICFRIASDSCQIRAAPARTFSGRIDIGRHPEPRIPSVPRTRVGADGCRSHVDSDFRAPPRTCGKHPATGQRGAGLARVQGESARPSARFKRLFKERVENFTGPRGRKDSCRRRRA
jgi:hypothetical protein